MRAQAQLPLAMTIILHVRTEDVVPDPGRYSEALVVGFEVMRHVVAAQFHEILALEAEVVQSIVGQVVDNIPNQESRKDAVNVIRQFEQVANKDQE